jgi:hypothetical protein
VNLSQTPVAPLEAAGSPAERGERLLAPAGADAERAARATLRGQIARLEAELSQILAQRFPFVYAPPAGADGHAGPHLPGLGELERTRDRLAARLAELQARAARRAAHERAARELLARMELEPGRYRYYRVPLRDLGEPGCGVYEVRPKLGLIGMLAGWWQLTLSSGCPLEKGSRPRRGPAEAL